MSVKRPESVCCISTFMHPWAGWVLKCWPTVRPLRARLRKWASSDGVVFMIIQDLFQEKYKQKHNQSLLACCRDNSDNSDMCTWLSKASDIQAPLNRKSRNRHHSTAGATGTCLRCVCVRARVSVCVRESVCVVTTAHTMGVCLWSHARSKYNTASRHWTVDEDIHRETPGPQKPFVLKLSAERGDFWPD